MIKVLIVSDNFELVKFIKNLATDKKNYFLDYSYSLVNKNPGNLISLGVTSIDLKDDNTINNIIRDYDLVISAHCKQIFPKRLVECVRCVNIHPGLNPYNRGWYPQVFSIINGLPIGCTIHEMDEEIDNGSIIYQSEVIAFPCDTSLDLYNRVQNEEKKLLTEHFDNIIFGQYSLINVKDKGNYNSVKDFNSLCHLDLSKTGSLGEHINLLRALTHGSFKNAYFTNDNGEKIFVKIELSQDSTS